MGGSGGAPPPCPPTALSIPFAPPIAVPGSSLPVAGGAPPPSPPTAPPLPSAPPTLLAVPPLSRSRRSPLPLPLAPLRSAHRGTRLVPSGRGRRSSPMPPHRIDPSVRVDHLGRRRS